MYCVNQDATPFVRRGSEKLEQGSELPDEAKTPTGSGSRLQEAEKHESTPMHPFFTRGK